MTKVGEYVNARIPVESFSDEAPDRPPPAPEPDVGARWGAPASLLIERPDETEEEEEGSPSVVVQRDTKIEFHGIGVQRAVDHNGKTVAEGPDPGNPSDFPAVTTLYFCGTRKEETEKVKTRNGTKIITPVITHIRQYVEWEAIPQFSYIEFEYARGHTN